MTAIMLKTGFLQILIYKKAHITSKLSTKVQLYA